MMTTIRIATHATITHHVDATILGESEPAHLQLQAIPGVKWDKSRRCYSGPREAVDIAAGLLERAQVCRVEYSAVVVGHIRWSPPGVSVETSLTLRDYQRDGVEWLIATLRSRGAALLADEMGLGKSAQAIAAVDEIPGRILVVCPAKAVPHWQGQITRWANRFGADYDESTAVFEHAAFVNSIEFRGAKQREAALQELRRLCRRWDVMSYEAFTALVKRDASFRTDYYGAVIFDEIHYLMNSSSDRGKAASSFVDVARRPPIIGLSGTPMTARPRDLHHPLSILFPGDFGDWFKFTRRYCDGHYEDIPNTLRSVWVTDGKSRLAELQCRLSHVMLRRTKAEVALELPTLSRELREVESSRQDFAAATLSHVGIQALLADAEATKLDAAIDLAREIVDSGGRPLLLTQRIETARQIALSLGVNHVDGSTPPQWRRETLLAGGPGVATLASVRDSIDLTEFDSAIFVGLSWVPSDLLQGEARVHRLGSLRPVTIYYLIALGTIDEIVREKVLERLDTFAAVVGADSVDVASALRHNEDDLLASIIAAASGFSGETDE